MKPVSHQDSKTDKGVFYRLSTSPQSVARLVMVMGYAGSLRTWPSSFVDNLAQHFAVLTYDNIGTGLTAPPSAIEDYSISRMEQSLQDVVEHLGWNRFHLLGYSMGGCIAMQHAYQHPAQVETLFLMSTTCGGATRVRPSAEIGQTLVNPPGNSLWEMYVSTFRTMFSEENFEGAMESIKQIYEQSKDYLVSDTTMVGHDRAFKSFDGNSLITALKMPTTVLAGADDKIISCRDGEAMAAKVANAKLIELENCGHAPHIQYESLVVSELLALTARTTPV